MTSEAEEDPRELTLKWILALVTLAQSIEGKQDETLKVLDQQNRLLKRAAKKYARAERLLNEIDNELDEIQAKSSFWRQCWAQLTRSSLPKSKRLSARFVDSKETPKKPRTSSSSSTQSEDIGDKKDHAVQMYRHLNSMLYRVKDKCDKIDELRLEQVPTIDKIKAAKDVIERKLPAGSKKVLKMLGR